MQIIVKIVVKRINKLNLNISYLSFYFTNLSWDFVNANNIFYFFFAIKSKTI